jgi:XTP/dITP diphosphohydrolase
MKEIEALCVRHCEVIPCTTYEAIQNSVNSKQPQIVIATRNKHKFEEITAILSDLNCQFIFAGDIPDLPEIEETGNSLLENAILKAENTAKLTNKPCIADDTGFFVQCLNGQPGLFSARYAGENCSYEDNLNKILNEIKNSKSYKKNQTAYFKTVAVLVPFKTEGGASCDACKGGSSNLVSEGTVEGKIIDTRRGKEGFGYDPIFIPNGSNKTYAEMTDEEKNLLSHRYIAFKGLKEKIKIYLSEDK